MGVKSQNTWSTIGSFVPLIGQGISALFQGSQNRKSRRWSEQMYNKQWQNETKFARDMYAQQRADAERFWNMQNTYNSPEQQMARLKAAGLNPNLVYGSGASAGQASSLRPPSAGSPNASVSTPSVRAPQIDTSAVVGTYMHMRQMNKQLQLMEAQRVKTLAEANNVNAGIPSTRVQARIDQALESTRITQAGVQLDAITADANMKMMSRNVAREMFNSGRTLKGAIADQVYKELRNQNMSAQRSQIFKAIEKMSSEIDLNKMSRMLKSTGLEGTSGPLGLQALMRMVIMMVLQNKKSFGAGSKDFRSVIPNAAPPSFYK